MGKHKNSTQNAIILEFMEKYPDLAKGFTKCDKPKVDALWQQLSESLNSAGPSQNDVNGWKKKWTEWKSEVKRKMAQNKAESRATGGGPYAKHQLTANEEAIVRLCGIAQSVEGVSGISLGLTEDVDVSVEEEMPSTSSKCPLVAVEEEMPSTSPKCPLVAVEEEMLSTSSKRPLIADVATSAPKRLRKVNTSDRLKKNLDDQSEINLELNANVKEMVNLKINKYDFYYKI
ncbi:uncharacterized protein LOC131801007 [Musca domestica]|uniref:Regulatory protein zeste n=1 Tax=Musca domestica TaxID=7370 RepID=A0ABM3UN00_MUSDO|nr:uncharacterized protein LOC131801007 [Musca domestica]